MGLKLWWSVVAMLLAAWSLCVWLGHALLAVLIGSATQLRWPEAALPEAWASWLPPALSDALAGALAALQPLLQWLVAQLPALAGGATVLAWVVWAVGAALLGLAGALLHACLHWWQRGQRPVAAHRVVV